MACIQTSMLTLITVYYPDRPGFARSIVEMFVGMGVVCGPILGGLLRETVGC